MTDITTNELAARFKVSTAYIRKLTLKNRLTKKAMNLYDLKSVEEEFSQIKKRKKLLKSIHQEVETETKLNIEENTTKEDIEVSLDNLSVTLGDLSSFFGCSVSQVRNLYQKGVFKKDLKDRFNLKQSIINYIEYKNNSDEIQKRKQEAELRKLEIEIKRLEGRYVDVDEAGDIITDFHSMIKNQLLHIPIKASPIIYNEKENLTISKINSILQNQVEETLHFLSEAQNYFDAIKSENEEKF